MSDRDRGGRAAQRRAEQIGWKKRPPSTSQASRTMDQHLRQMNQQASLLDKRLRHHGDDSESWHKKWDEPPRLG
jgi:hypothetical protein